MRAQRPTHRPTGYVGDHADKLSRVSGLHHDADERPSREDLVGAERRFEFGLRLLARLTRRRAR
ncbi:MAG TPA: hypothetical protein VLA98_11500 [Solirubrobacteraceae bacterium]|nr:hypothetical protein [Solirubrobacteraceae bacterium]HSD79304.1 hypothetical protein [Solirubrobacteraceae bacterium]